MKILVPLKQVPDAGSRLVPSADGRWIDEESVSFVPNEYDLFALEAALQLKDADSDVEIVVASIGPDRVRQAVRTALAMGADRAVLLVDEAFQGGDPWAASAALAAVARTEGPFDAIFCGLQAGDDNFALTGPLLAERLEMPCATTLVGWKREGAGFVVERELEGDRREVVELPMPCVLTFQTGAGEKPPRYANIKGIMAAKKKEVKTPTPAELGVEASDVGAAGRRMSVIGIGEPPKSAGADMISGSVDEIAQEVVKRIREKTGVI